MLEGYNWKLITVYYVHREKLHHKFNFNSSILWPWFQDKVFFKNFKTFESILN